MKNELNNWHVASVMPPAIGQVSKQSHVYYGWTPCIEWCEQTFGEITMDNFRWRFISEGVFEFKHEQDLTAFLLKWA
jgi:hypothetical protein